MKPEELHDIAVTQIARERFFFPESEFVPGVFHPTWATYTNVPQRQMALEHKWLGKLYPDIIIVDTAKSNAPKLVAEVETEETLTLETLAQKWKLYQDECRTLYVFVPEGCAQRIADLILEYRIAFPTALFTYGFADTGDIRITAV